MKRLIAARLRTLAQRLDPKPELIELRPVSPEKMATFRTGPGIIGHPYYYSYDRNGDNSLVYLYPPPDQDFRIYWRGTW